MREQDAKEAEMAAEATRLATTHNLAEAREQEHMMVVQVVIALKAEEDEEHARLIAERRANEELIHREQVLEVVRE